jgi:hypothetical protein
VPVRHTDSDGGERLEPAPVPELKNVDGGTRARTMRQLQAEQGNAFVQRLVSALGQQSKDDATAPVQRDGRDAKISSLLQLDVRTHRTSAGCR